jgi:hypothetical protein
MYNAINGNIRKVILYILISINNNHKNSTSIVKPYYKHYYVRYMF